MSLSIYISNSILSLAQAMNKAIEEPKASVFTPHLIVTQTQGMNNWLKFQIAKELGIAANIRFLKPAEVIWEIYKIMGGSALHKVDKKEMDLIIYAILSKEEFKKNYKKQAAYYFENEVRNEMKQWEFAAKIADLFDQYQIYRTAVIVDWNEKSLESIDVQYRWQAYIWKQIKYNFDKDILDFTEIRTAILKGINDPQKITILQKRLPQLSLFGLSIISPFHLEIFYNLSLHINIDWYISNPAPDHFWFEDESEERIFKQKMLGKNIAHLNIGNSLLTSWAKVIQHTFRMFFKSDEFINAVEDLPSIAPKGNTLLSNIQKDMFENALQASIWAEDKLKDKTITITSNYSKRREVEVVYNYILNAVLTQQFGAITERDIIVMVSDINAYAPFIRAVMDNAPYKFQYTIADESISNGDTIVSALIKLLEVSGSVFSAEAVLQLLNSALIRNKFGIYNTELIRNIVQDANIKFGIENDYHQNQDDTYLVSWKYGLQKIMFGLCMASSEKLHINDKELFTLDCADSASDIQQIVALTGFVNLLIKAVQKRQQPKLMWEWHQYMDEIIETFLLTDEELADEEQMKIVNRFKEEIEIDQLLNDEKISFDVFSKRLISRLNNESTSSNFLNKGITFCSPLPFRSIPFKVVAILGLNHDAFPRKEQRIEFDLISKTPQLGDRNIKQNDKHLFLESVLSAESALYLSYIGRSVKDNKPYPPSVLIDELLDYIQSGIDDETIDVRKLLVEQHPLHSYSTQYNQKDSTILPNYLIQKEEVWPIQLKENIADESSIIANYDINTVWKFFDKSINYYYNKVLQIYVEQEENEIESTEKLGLDHLENWSLKQTLLSAKINNTFEETVEDLYLNANLPLRNIAKSVIQHTEQTIESQLATFEDLVGAGIQAQSLPIHYVFNTTLFTGKVHQIFENKIVELNYGKEKQRFKARAKLILNYLFAQANGHNLDGAILMHSDGAETLATINQKEAQIQLQQVLTTFLALNEKAVMFSLDTYSDKYDENNFIEKLKAEIVRKAEYNEYYAHALNTLDINEQADYYDELNSIFQNIFTVNHGK